MRALACLLALATVAHASEPNIVGMGVRSPGMAGTGVADTTGYEAAYTNPAGLAGASQRQINVGYIVGRYHLDLDDKPRSVDGTEGLLLGANVPLPFGGFLKDKLGVGLGFYLPGTLITRARAPFPDETRLALLETQTQTVSITVALGAQLHRRLQVGIGVLALAALAGQITIRSDAGGRITTLSEQQLVTGFAPTAGVRVLLRPWVTVGASLVGESKATYDIRVSTQLSGQLPIDLPPLRFLGVAQYDPLRLSMEGSFVPRDWVRINAGFTFKNWARYQRPIENATPGAPELPEPGFKDTVVPRIAVELTARSKYLRFDGRLGYFFEWSPAPSGPGRVLLDADRHALTFGVGLQLLRWVGLRVDAYGQFHQLAGSPRAGGQFGFFGCAMGLDL